MTRINWSVEPHLSKLKAAVKEYLSTPASYGTKNAFAKNKGIPKGTLFPYIENNIKDRKSLANITGLGRNSVISDADELAIVDFFVLKDRLSKGDDNQKGIAAVHEILPIATAEQARNSWNRIKLKYRRMKRKILRT